MGNDNHGDVEQQIKALRDYIEARFARVEEVIRESHAEMIRGLQYFAQSYQKRLLDIEHSEALIKDRMAILEERLLDLERRLGIGAKPN